MGGKRERVRSTILEREKSKDDGGIDGKICRDLCKGCDAI